MELKTIDVATAKANQFAKKNIYTAEDLVMYLPRRYIDCTKVTGFLPDTEVSCVVAKFISLKFFSGGKVSSGLTAYCEIPDTGEMLRVTWFNQPWIESQIGWLRGRNVFVAGKATYDWSFNNYTISNPEIFAADAPSARRVIPVYSKIPGMSYDYLTSKIQSALAYPDTSHETIPADILEANGQVTMREALLYLHRPQNMAEVEIGKERVLFNDLLRFAVAVAHTNRDTPKGSSYNVKSLKLYNAILASLPYSLTSDQKSALESMVAMAREGKRINALLQGDVGCGKSIVAFLLMAAFVDSGYQTVIMAPTQVLAAQHYKDLSELMEPFGINVAFLEGSSMKAAEKRRLQQGIESGEVQMIVGTHAVIGESVTYHNLGLVITDEEHRFGVSQREALVAKAAQGVHALTMSATPIPRSLAHVIYGDMVQLFTIETMPANRHPVNTGMISTEEKLFRFIASQAKQGHQTYVVCPMIDKNEDMTGVRSIEEVYEEYSSVLEPQGVHVAALSGRTKKTEAAEILERFKNCETPVLISTTVVEVGVNVPTATLIVVVNAERFGLASLHQLRGRVGRGEWQSYCVLDSRKETLDKMPEAKARLDAMCRTTSGFEIAEADLQLRGAGEFLGVAQSGDNKYMQLMIAYPDKYKKAQEIAEDLLDRADECEFVKDALTDLECAS